MSLSEKILVGVSAVVYLVAATIYLVSIVICSMEFGPRVRIVAGLVLSWAVALGCARFDAVRTALLGQVRLRR